MDVESEDLAFWVSSAPPVTLVIVAVGMLFQCVPETPANFLGRHASTQDVSLVTDKSKARPVL